MLKYVAWVPEVRFNFAIRLHLIPQLCKQILSQFKLVLQTRALHEKFSAHMKIYNSSKEISDKAIM